MRVTVACHRWALAGLERQSEHPLPLLAFSTSNSMTHESAAAREDLRNFTPPIAQEDGERDGGET